MATLPSLRSSGEARVDRGDRRGREERILGSLGERTFDYGGDVSRRAWSDEELERELAPVEFSVA